MRLLKHGYEWLEFCERCRVSKRWSVYQVWAGEDGQEKRTQLQEKFLSQWCGCPIEGLVEFTDGSRRREP